MDPEKSKELRDRLDNEPGNAYTAFERFISLDPRERSVLAAYRSHAANPLASKVSDTFGGWSRTYAWAERAIAYDLHLASIRREAHERAVQEEAERYARLVERSRYELMEELTGLHDGTMEFLENLDWSSPNVRLRDVIQVVKLRVEAVSRFEAELPEKRGGGAEWTEDELEFVEGIVRGIEAERDDETPDENEEDPGENRP
jgi:hypothetical protein